MPATAAVTAVAANSGSATRRAMANGSDPVRAAHISTTAATGDMVRPAAAAIDTTAPTRNSTGTPMPFTTKNGNRLVVEAIPEPHNAANASASPAAHGHKSDRLPA